MKRFRNLRFGLAALCALSALSFPSIAPAQSTPHDRQFWREIAKNHYAVPPGQSASALAAELSANLASTDSELRDDLAYSIFYVWIVRQNQLSSTELLSLFEQWQSNLRVGIGESGTDSIFRRSFSALCLASIAERELKSPFLGEDRYRAFLSSTLAYLNDERDLRGFDPVKGWIHATAHTADLLAMLANHPNFKLDDQRRLLNAVANRLASANEIFSYGEQDRLASAIATITERKDFDAAAFHAWLTTLEATDRKVWNTSPPKAEALKTFQNNSYLLQALAARLAAKPANPQVSPALGEVTLILAGR